jgi:16S rRNA C967 or C1407 C5-methylase (RsmB/RsmF family)
MLKPGGILVYSTCSFSKAQNEDIIEWFLGSSEYATVEAIPNVIKYPVVMSKTIKHTVYFDPEHSNTSGLFVARIRKNSHKS